MSVASLKARVAQNLRRCCDFLSSCVRVLDTCPWKGTFLTVEVLAYYYNMQLPFIDTFADMLLSSCYGRLRRTDF